MKHYYGIVFILFFITVQANERKNNGIDTTPYQQSAATWVQQFIGHDTLLLPATDLNHIANLFYLSYYRSKMTLDAQREALKSLSTFWQSWQNIAQTRRNPSQKPPFCVTENEIQAAADTFIHNYKHHQLVNQWYARIVEKIVEGPALTSAQALKAVNSVRKNSRIVVIQAIIDIKEVLNQLFALAQKKQEQLGENLDLYQEEFTKIKKVLDFLWEYIPQLALSNFVKAEQVYNKISEENWSILQSVQNIGNQLWYAIEKERASFYLAYYQALYTHIKQHNLLPTGIMAEFEQQELSPVYPQLPNPEQLP